jgi:Zn-dependent M28 family amino/carboxypeptidase
MALLEIAQAFKIAVKDGFRPKRSIVFLHVTGEEKGLLGSKYYVENPLYPLEQTIVNLNVDMIGRLDPQRELKNTDYIYLIGSDRLSTQLHEVSEQINSETVNLDLDYKFSDPEHPERFYERSDHYNFAKNNIPVIFYFSGTHEDYHGTGDTPDKILYDIYTTRTKLIFHTAWEIANMDERIEVDQN